MNKTSEPDYISKLLIKAAEPGTLRERQRQICWKVLHMLDPECSTVWWRVKMNVKLWIHRRMWGHDYE